MSSAMVGIIAGLALLGAYLLGYKEGEEDQKQEHKIDRQFERLKGMGEQTVHD